MKRTLKDRLLAKIDTKSVPGHWIWTGTFNPPRPKLQRRAFIRTTATPAYNARRLPRPVMVVNGKLEQVRRLVWIEFRNPDLPKEVYVRRMETFCIWWQCVNPACHTTPSRRIPRTGTMAFIPPSQQNNREAGMGNSAEIAELADELEGRYGRVLDETPFDEIAEEFDGFARFEIAEAIEIVKSRG